eukprot:s178_g27.t1
MASSSHPSFCVAQLGSPVECRNSAGPSVHLTSQLYTAPTYKWRQVPAEPAAMNSISQHITAYHSHITVSQADPVDTTHHHTLVGTSAAQEDHFRREHGQQANRANRNPLKRTDSLALFARKHSARSVSTLWCTCERW